MGMTIPWLFLLILNPLNSLLSHPPRDFASLLDPPAILQTMGVQTTDEALIAVLNAPAEPAPGVLYVKKLMAIRLLEQNRSANALPALEAAAKGNDVTLRDAALEAIAAINGNPSPRPSGAALLKQLAQSVPADAGFVVALDFARDSSSLTARARLENALREFQAKIAAQYPNAQQPDSPAGMMRQGVEQFVGAIIPQAEQGIVQALAATGNVRVDAAMLILPPRMGTHPNESFIRCAVKGLYDPARIAGLLEGTGDFEKRQVAGHVVYVNRRGEVEIGLLDPNTLALVIMNKSGNAAIMEGFLSALTAAEKGGVPKPLAEAFDLVTERHARLAVAGTFSPAQKQNFAATLMENMKPTNLQLGPAEQIAFSGSQMLLNALKAQAYAASVEPQGKLNVLLVCPDAATATELSDSANKLQKTLFELLTREATAVPPPLAVALRDIVQQGYLWKTEAADNTVTMTTENLLTPIVGMALIQVTPQPPPEAPPTPPGALK